MSLPKFKLDFWQCMFCLPVLPPSITESDVTVIEGDDLNLTCINNNPSGVSQEWLDSEGYLVSTDATYTVENVTRNVTGVYTCVLTGVNNYTEGHNASVEVQCKFIVLVAT